MVRLSPLWTLVCVATSIAAEWPAGLPRRDIQILHTIVAHQTPDVWLAQAREKNCQGLYEVQALLGVASMGKMSKALGRGHALVPAYQELFGELAKLADTCDEEDTGSSWFTFFRP